MSSHSLVKTKLRIAHLTANSTVCIIEPGSKQIMNIEVKIQNLNLVLVYLDVILIIFKL